MRHRIGKYGDPIGIAIVDIDFVDLMRSELVGLRVLTVEHHKISVATDGKTAEPFAGLAQANGNVLGIG